MQNRVIHAILGMWLALAAPAQAQNTPAVLELFTSQGCSSCPPADELLSTYADRDDVIALALHVDYWDYIGWKDTFADPAFTRRQKAYAYAAHRNMVYTPQMIIGGHDNIVGHKPAELAESVMRNLDRPRRVVVGLQRDGERVTISADRLVPGLGPLIVQLVRYIPEETVEIRRGENAGRVLRYSNIVTSLEVLRRWSGERPLSLSADAPGSDPVVVLVQHEGHGPIVAAARLR